MGMYLHGDSADQGFNIWLPHGGVNVRVHVHFVKFPEEKIKKENIPTEIVKEREQKEREQEREQKERVTEYIYRHLKILYIKDYHLINFHRNSAIFKYIL